MMMVVNARNWKDTVTMINYAEARGYESVKVMSLKKVVFKKNDNVIIINRKYV